MPKASELFPSKYLKASDLAGKFVRAIIGKIEIIDVGGKGEAGDTKPVVSLKNRSKQLVLNKTNTVTLAKAFGDELDDWAGEEIEIYPDTVSMQGQIVDCIRVRKPIEQDFDRDVDF